MLAPGIQKWTGLASHRGDRLSHSQTVIMAAVNIFTQGCGNTVCVAHSGEKDFEEIT